MQRLFHNAQIVLQAVIRAHRALTSGALNAARLALELPEFVDLPAPWKPAIGDDLLDLQFHCRDSHHHSPLAQSTPVCARGQRFGDTNGSDARTTVGGGDSRSAARKASRYA